MRMRGLLVMLAAAVAGTLGGMDAAAADLPAAQCAPPPVAADTSLQAELDAIVDNAVAGGFAGQVAVMRRGAYIYRRAAGSADLAGEIPVTTETLFHVASVTKYFTAALVLRAVEEGRIHLDDSVAPWSEGTGLAKRGVTFSDLLAHRSGLGSSYAAESHDDPRAAIAAIDKAGIDESRAGAFRYSNDGYDVLAILLERVYGQSYESLVRKKLFAPACLTHVGFWGETGLADARIVGQPPGGFPSRLRKRNYGMIGSAGLLITASELVAWQQALTGGRVLSAPSLEQLFAPRGKVRMGQSAFGTFLIDHPRLGRVISARGAEDWGDNAYLNDYLDCGVTVAIVTSRGPAEDSGKPRFRDSISQAIEQILAGHCAA